MTPTHYYTIACVATAATSPIPHPSRRSFCLLLLLLLSSSARCRRRTNAAAAASCSFACRCSRRVRRTAAPERLNSKCIDYDRVIWPARVECTCTCTAVKPKCCACTPIYTHDAVRVLRCVYAKGRARDDVYCGGAKFKNWVVPDSHARAAAATAAFSAEFPRGHWPFYNMYVVVMCDRLLYSHDDGLSSYRPVVTGMRARDENTSRDRTRNLQSDTLFIVSWWLQIINIIIEHIRKPTSELVTTSPNQ